MSSRFDEFLGFLRGFDHGMLVTRHSEGDLKSRPMAIAGCGDDAHLWFITRVDSTIVSDLTEHPHVNLCLQDGKRFVAMSGTARATRDPERIRDLWSEDQRVWFEKGREDPSLILLEVVPTFAEYWDRSGLEGVKFLVSELVALASGGTMTGDESQHGVIEFSEPATSSRTDRKGKGSAGAP